MTKFYNNYYAIYKGDNHLFSGSLSECSKYLGINENSIKFYASPTYKKRTKEDGNALIVIRVEREDEDGNTI